MSGPLPGRDDPGGASRDEERAEPALRRALERRKRGARVLLWFVIFLAMLAAGQAVILVPMLGELGAGGRVAAVREENLPERTVRVFRAEGEVRLILKSPLDLPEADEDRAAELDARLFPGGERHRYFVLYAANPGEVGREVPLSPLSLVDSDGKSWPAVDLAGVLREREGDLPEYLRFYLGIRIPAGDRVSVAPRSAREVLVAFPIGPGSAGIDHARLGEAALRGEEMRKDDLDGILAEPGGSPR